MHIRTRDHRHARRLHRAARLILVSHAANDLGRRTDKLDVALGAQIGKVRVLREQAVSRMDGLRAGKDGRGENGAHIQIAFLRLRGADAIALIRKRDMQRIAIRLGKNGDRADCPSPCRRESPERNLAPVGNQYFRKHPSALLILYQHKESSPEATSLSSTARSPRITYNRAWNARASRKGSGCPPGGRCRGSAPYRPPA